MRINIVVAGVFVGLALAWSYPAGAQEEPCYYVDMEKISEETVKETAEELQRQGWYSDPMDRAEALYSPSCLSSEAKALEQRAMLEQVRALRAEVDQLRTEVRELLSIIEEVVDTFRL
jgi:hypothetical protein